MMESLDPAVRGDGCAEQCHDSFAGGHNDYANADTPALPLGPRFQRVVVSYLGSGNLTGRSMGLQGIQQFMTPVIITGWK